MCNPTNQPSLVLTICLLVDLRTQTWLQGIVDVALAVSRHLGWFIRIVPRTLHHRIPMPLSSTKPLSCRPYRRKGPHLVTPIHAAEKVWHRLGPTNHLVPLLLVMRTRMPISHLWFNSLLNLPSTLPSRTRGYSLHHAQSQSDEHPLLFLGQFRPMLSKRQIRQDMQALPQFTITPQVERWNN